MPMPDKATFRTAFPEFSDDEIYPDAQIDYWYDVGVLQLNETRWANLLPHGLNLFVAHNISLSATEIGLVAGGGMAGQGSGLMSGYGVGDVSVSFDTSSVGEESAGDWNLTLYGRKLLRLARIVGIGGLQLL